MTRGDPIQSFEDRQPRQEAASRLRNRRLLRYVGLPLAAVIAVILIVVLTRDVRAALAAPVHAIAKPGLGALVRDGGLALWLGCEAVGLIFTQRASAPAGALPPLALRGASFVGCGAFLIGLEFGWVSASARHETIAVGVVCALGMVGLALSYLPVLMAPRRGRGR